MNGKLTVVVQTKGARKALLGHFSADRWGEKEGGSSHEISLVSEELRGDPVDVLGVMHHELVHMYNHEHDVKDTSESGRHNLRFKEAALDHGLEYPVDDDGKAHPHPSRGWQSTILSEGLRDAIVNEFQPNYAVFERFRELMPTKVKQPTKMKKWTCSCLTEDGNKEKYIVRTTAKLVATCQECGNEFVKAPGQDDGE